MRGALALAAAALVSGCNPPEPGFARLGTFHIQALAMSFNTRVIAMLLYDTPSTGCQVLADFSATADGAPLSVFAGGAQPGHAYCEPPTIDIPRPRSPASVVSVEARSGEDVLSIQLQRIGLEMGGTPLLASGESVHPGQTVRIALEPGWDLLSWPEKGFVRVEGTSAESETLVVSPPVDGVLEVRLPDSLPAGSVRLRVVPTSTPRFLRCDAPGDCSIPTSEGGLTAPLLVTVPVAP